MQYSNPSFCLLGMRGSYSLMVVAVKKEKGDNESSNGVCEGV